MNCYCNQPVITKVAQNGDHPGRSFFSCRSSSCRFFQWADGQFPPRLKAPSVAPRPVAPSSSSKSTSSFPRLNHGGYSSSSSSAGVGRSDLAPLKLTLGSFEEKEDGSVTVWFGVITSFNSGELTKFFLSLPESARRFKERVRMWEFSFDVYTQFVDTLSEAPFNAQLRVEPLPSFVSAAVINFTRKMKATSGPVTLNIEQKLREKLHAFQIRGVDFVIRRGGRALIGDEMGCGKTAQAIAVIQHYRQHWPVMIMLPIGLLDQWTRELITFSGNIIAPDDICALTADAKAPTAAKIYLVPYSMIEKLVSRKRISPEQFGVVIADESHNLKNRETKRSGAAMPFLKKAQIALCLSGTPATNRPVELYAQLNGLLPDTFKDFDAFTRRYCDAKPDRFAANKMDTRGCSNGDELKALLEGVVMIRRLKADVLVLPKKAREVKWVTVDARYATEIGKLEKQYEEKERRLNDPHMDQDTAQHVRTELNSLRMTQYCVVGDSKVEGIKALLGDLVQELRGLRVTAAMVDASSSSSHEEGETGSAAEVIDEEDEEEDEVEIVERVKTPPPLIDLCADSVDEQKRNSAKQRHLSEKEAVVTSPSRFETDAEPDALEDRLVLDSDLAAEHEESADTDADADEDNLVDSDEEIEVLRRRKASPFTRRLRRNILMSSGSKSALGGRSRLQSSANPASRPRPQQLAKDQDDDESFSESAEDDEKDGNVSEGDDLFFSDRPAPALPKPQSLSRPAPTKRPSVTGKRKKPTTGSSAKKPSRVTSKAKKKRQDVIDLCDDESEDESEDLCDNDDDDDEEEDDDAYDDLSFIDNDISEGEDEEYADDDPVEELADSEDEAGVVRARRKAGRSKVSARSKAASTASVSAVKRMFKGAQGGKKTKAAKGAKQTKAMKAAEAKNADAALRELKPLGKKIIVFAHHKNVLKALEEFLVSQAVGFVRIDGDVTNAKRDALVTKFQFDNTTDVALLSLTACGTGLNLTRASIAVFAELHDSLGMLLQAEDRIHRFGQDAESIRIIYVVAKKTVDESIWKQMQRKHNVLSETVGIADNTKGLGMSISSTVGSRSHLLHVAVAQRGTNNGQVLGPSEKLPGGPVHAPVTGTQTSMDSFLRANSPTKKVTDVQASSSPTGQTEYAPTPSVPPVVHSYTAPIASTSAKAVLPVSLPVVAKTNAAPVALNTFSYDVSQSQNSESQSAFVDLCLAGGPPNTSTSATVSTRQVPPSQPPIGYPPSSVLPTGYGSGYGYPPQPNAQWRPSGAPPQAPSSTQPRPIPPVASGSYLPPQAQAYGPQNPAHQQYRPMSGYSAPAAPTGAPSSGHIAAPQAQLPPNQPIPASTLPPDVAARIEANRLRALEIRRQRELEMQSAAHGAARILLATPSCPPSYPASYPPTQGAPFPPRPPPFSAAPPHVQPYQQPEQLQGLQLRTGGGSAVGVSRDQLDKAEMFLNNNPY